MNDTGVRSITSLNTHAGGPYGHPIQKNKKGKCVNPYITIDGPMRCRKIDCPSCKELRRFEWLGRLAAEAFTAKAVRFVTLTYSDEYLKSGVGLPPEHIKKYVRQRRRKYSFKHYTVGEYGEKTGRPHWHSIQFYEDVVPSEVLDFSMLQFGWGKGNSQYEIPRSIAGSCAYLYDYVDKGGKALRPSPGIGYEYLRRHARFLARNRRPLVERGAIRYTVANSRDLSGNLWKYFFPISHHWTQDFVEEYLDEWELTQKDEPPCDYMKGIY